MPIVTFEGVSKYFHRHPGQMLLRERLMRLLQPVPRERFYALQDVSFAVKQGESLGIIGHNGAGKSTLLNIATGLCRPNTGLVSVQGRVAALLELGSGFHPDLTGSENIRINAALLGLTRSQTREHYNQIVDFSGIGDFIDEPLRTFSSGMVMRLAFSVAINVAPDVLIIDEVLGVGDQEFFAKCFERVLEFRRMGRSMLVVSHSLETLEQLCDSGLWLDHGCVVKSGPIGKVLEAYARQAHTQAIAMGE